MKKLYLLAAFSISTIAFAQSVSDVVTGKLLSPKAKAKTAYVTFSPETKTAYKNLVEEGIKNGLPKEEAIEKTLENADFKKIYLNDLKQVNEVTSKQGIILSKNFIKLTSHVKVAILPFSTEIVSDKKKQSKKENIKNQENAMDLIQDEMYKHFAKNQFDYFVEFQDIDRTNQILRNSGLWNNLSRTPTEDIAKALGVDAVIRGDYEQGTKNKGGILTLSIADAKTGEVLWRKESADKSSQKPEKILKFIMESINKSFPYLNELVD